MQLHISTNDGVPIYRQIVDQVKYLVASGTLEVGEQLPPVRKLAEELLINPNTVARAYRDLEVKGIVSSRQGAGVFVAEPKSPLKQSEKKKRLGERIDQLLAEARQMNVDIDTVVELVRERVKKFE